MQFTGAPGSEGAAEIALLAIESKVFTVEDSLEFILHSLGPFTFR